jgi:hypothetical protein
MSTLLHIIEGLAPEHWSWLEAASVAAVRRWLAARDAPDRLAPRLIALARQRPALHQLLEPSHDPAALLAQLVRAGRSPGAMLGAMDAGEARALLAALCGVSAPGAPSQRLDGWPVWRFGELDGLYVQLPQRWALPSHHRGSLALRVDGHQIARYVPDGLRYRWRLIEPQPLPAGRLERDAALRDITTGAVVAALPLVGSPAALFVGGRRVWRVDAGEETVCVFDHGAHVASMSGGFARDEVWSARHGRELWRGVFPSEPLTAWDEVDAALLVLAPGQPVWPQRGVLAPTAAQRWPFEVALFVPRHPHRAAPLDRTQPLRIATLQSAAALEVRAAPWALVHITLGAWSAELTLDSRGRARIWRDAAHEALWSAALQADALLVTCGQEQLRLVLSHEALRGRGALPAIKLIPSDSPDVWRVENARDVEGERFWLRLTPCANPWTSHRVEVDAATCLVTLPVWSARGRYDVRAEGASAGVGQVELDGTGAFEGALGAWFAPDAEHRPEALSQALMALEAVERRGVIAGLVTWHRHHHTQHRLQSEALVRALAPWRLVALLDQRSGVASDEARALLAMPGIPAWYELKPRDLWCALELAGPLGAARWRCWFDALDALGGGLRAMAMEVWRAPLSALATSGWIMPEPAPGTSVHVSRPLHELDQRELPWERLACVPSCAPLSAAEAALVADPRERIVADCAYALHRERLGLWSAPLPAAAHRLARSAPALMDHWLNIWTRRERLLLQEQLAADTTWPHIRRGPMRR